MALPLIVSSPGSLYVEPLLPWVSAPNLLCFHCITLAEHRAQLCRRITVDS